MTQAAVIAALYIVLTLIANALGLANYAIQLRFSEALTILPYYTAASGTVCGMSSCEYPYRLRSLGYSLWFPGNTHRRCGHISHRPHQKAFSRGKMALPHSSDRCKYDNRPPGTHEGIWIRRNPWLFHSNRRCRRGPLLLRSWHNPSSCPGKKKRHPSGCRFHAVITAHLILNRCNHPYSQSCRYMRCRCHTPGGPTV